VIVTVTLNPAGARCRGPRGHGRRGAAGRAGGRAMAAARDAMAAGFGLRPGIAELAVTCYARRDGSARHVVRPGGDAGP
jgi:hypothetical protein